MALETLVLLENPKQRDLAISLAKNLSSQRWYSTQETAYALLSMAKMVMKNGGKSIALNYTQNGQKINVKSDRAIAQRNITINNDVEHITIQNNQDNIIYTTLTQSGKLPVGKELAQQQKLNLKVQYLDPLSKSINVSSIRQGTEFEAKITVFNATDDAINNIALTQIVPSGWEIVDTSYANVGNSNAKKTDYIDTRDDRTNLYFGLEARKGKVFHIKLNASFLGEYYLPGSQVEAMYDNTVIARTKGQWVKVVQ